VKRHLFAALLITGPVLLVAVFGRPGLAEDPYAQQNVSPWPRMPTAAGDRDSYGIVPDPPPRPVAVSRPAAWPGGPGASPQGDMPRVDVAGRPEAPGGYRPPLEAPIPCEGAAILAKVGEYAILASEVMPTVNAIIEQNKDRIPPSQLEAQRNALVKRQLEQLVDNKIIYCDARRGIPEESYENVAKQISEQFEKVEMKAMMKRAKVTNRRQLNEKMLVMGTSLERERRAYVERTLGKQWVHHQIDFDKEITHEERLAYYQEHLADFEKPARARWEQLTVKFSKCPNKAEAYRILAEMGNRVIDGDANTFARVAKARSHGSTASAGGIHDWTTKGSLVSDELDRALFTLPLGKLGPIMEDERGLHIVRVLERREAGRTSFIEAQGEIREKIRQHHIRDQLETYLAKLKKDVPVWTVFDGQPDRQIAGRPNPPRR